MKKMIMKIFTLLAVSGLILSGCAAREASPTLSGTSWKLVSYGPTGNQITAAQDIETNLDFSSDGQVSGNVGCNSFSGSYEVKDGKLGFNQIISTMMACPEPQMTQESTVFQVMTGEVNYELTSNTLTIYDPSGAISINLLKVEIK